MIGPNYLGHGQFQYSIWAPSADTLTLHLMEPKSAEYPLQKDTEGYFKVQLEDITPGQSYYLVYNETQIPDPLSRYQPQGIHGPSQIIDPNFEWTDQSWSGLPLKDYIIYELHTGTFTRRGTFTAIIDHLDELKELGITAIELMPVAQFSGARNWGYDGALLYAVQNSYGGPYELKKLINSCHNKGLAVILDVVYNHFGPEGNYLADLGPYFTNRYETPWGEAINYDTEGNEHVRRYMIDNALMWFDEYHIDALRLDALHAIYDQSKTPFLKQLAKTIDTYRQKQSRQCYLIGESDLNDPILIRNRNKGGYGLDAQWNDDFHHSLHVLLTGEQQGYYQDFKGVTQLKKALKEGYIYTGEYSPFRQDTRGAPGPDLELSQFVVFSQNHDQVGNRARGERLTHLVHFEKLKLAAGLIILSPNIPLLFMGEEYAENAPFLYFVDHTDPRLNQAVYEGRKEEFSPFHWDDDIPLPYTEATFEQSRLNHNLKTQGHHQILYRFYQKLIELRKSNPALSVVDKTQLEVNCDEPHQILIQKRMRNHSRVLIITNFSTQCHRIDVPCGDIEWEKLLDSGEKAWQGKTPLAQSKLNADNKTVLVPDTHFSVFRGKSVL